MEKKSKNKLKSSCCAPATFVSSCCSPGPNERTITKISGKASPDWSRSDRLGEIRCRLTSYRMKYRVSPGLYALGEPGADSDVFVSANYKLSFDILRRALKGMNAWILVLDTKGINVWCAAGKGTFGTDELINSINETGLKGAVRHRRLIVPQLGAPGIAAHAVERATGFRVHYGPVDANSIPEYVRMGYMATRQMRTVKFTWKDRLVLTPMELIPSLKYFSIFSLIVFLFQALRPGGPTIINVFSASVPFLIYGFSSVISGAFLAPLMLPYIPSRSFALKGWILGLISFLAASGVIGFPENAPESISAFIIFPLFSSYIALQFTGSTTFTSISGVRKELKLGLPLYITGAAAAVVLMIIARLGEWRLI